MKRALIFFVAIAIDDALARQRIQRLATGVRSTAYDLANVGVARATGRRHNDIQGLLCGAACKSDAGGLSPPT